MRSLHIEEVMRFRMIQLLLNYLYLIKIYGLFPEALFNRSMVLLAVQFLHMQIFLNRTNRQVLLYMRV